MSVLCFDPVFQQCIPHHWEPPEAAPGFDWQPDQLQSHHQAELPHEALDDLHWWQPSCHMCEAPPAESAVKTNVYRIYPLMRFALVCKPMEGQDAANMCIHSHMQYTTKMLWEPQTNVYFQDFFNAQSVNSVFNWMKRKRHIGDLHSFTQITVSRGICGCTALSKNYIVFMSCISSYISRPSHKSSGDWCARDHIFSGQQ